MKKKILALSLILSVAALSGCKGEAEASESVQTAPQTSSFTTTAPPTTESAETSEPEREIRTSAETKEGVIALFLTAFAEKDNEALRAFHCGSFDESYDEMFNSLCKALDKEGNLPDDLNDIDLAPQTFEVYHIISRFDDGGEHEEWEAVYAPANGRFTIWFKEFTDYDYVSQTYSVKSMQIMNEIYWGSHLSLDDYRRYAANGEAFPYNPQFSKGRNVYFEAIDITPYLD